MNLTLLKYIYRLGFALILVFSLTLNVAMFLGGSIYSVASAVFGAATGIRTVAVQHADEVAKLTRNITAEKTARKKLKSKAAGISKELMTERKVGRKLKGKVAGLSKELLAERIVSKKIRKQLSKKTVRVVFRGKKVALKEAVTLISERISKRAIRTTGRSISSMAGEAIPYLGTVVIVSVTALDLKDLCNTVKDMNELKRAFNPDLQVSDNDSTVCSVKVPTATQLWEKAKASPGQAWATAKEMIPTLEEIKNYKFPDIDWAGARHGLAVKTSNVWHSTLSGANTALDATKITTGGVIDRVTKYWSSNGETGKTD